MRHFGARRRPTLWGVSGQTTRQKQTALQVRSAGFSFTLLNPTDLTPILAQTKKPRNDGVLDAAIPAP
jgi:hypothetical protein